MKKIILALSVVTLAACSSTSKEVYTEKRVFTYPKGQTPHLKDMYLRDQGQENKDITYTGVSNPSVIVNDNQYVNPDVPYFEPDLPSNSLDDAVSAQRELRNLYRENDLLVAKAYNQMLKERQN